MISAVIFDLDGLLIDSEPLWEAAEMVIFPQLGVPLTPTLKKQTTGLRADDIVQYWHTRYPWREPSLPIVATALIQRLIELVNERGTLQPGARRALDLCARTGLPLAIASSSPTPLIQAVLAKLDIDRYFEVVHSAEHEPFGKPHPAVYLTAAQQLGAQPERCLAFEDSPNGVLSAKAAKMCCIAVPDPAHRAHRVIQIADRVLDSLADFQVQMLTDLGPAAEDR